MSCWEEQQRTTVSEVCLQNIRMWKYPYLYTMSSMCGPAGLTDWYHHRSSPHIFMMQARWTVIWVQTPSVQICPEKEDLVKGYRWHSRWAITSFDWDIRNRQHNIWHKKGQSISSWSQRSGQNRPACNHWTEEEFPNVWKVLLDHESGQWAKTPEQVHDRPRSTHRRQIRMFSCWYLSTLYL